MLSYIHCDRGGILQHITEVCDHTVRISFWCGIINCLKIFFNLCADIQPVTYTLYIRIIHFCKTINHCSCLCLKLYLILTILMDISLKIVWINIYTYDLCTSGKFMYFGSDLSGTQRNAKAEKQIAFCIGDHICITVSIGTADAPEIQRMVVSQN